MKSRMILSTNRTDRITTGNMRKSNLAAGLAARFCSRAGRGLVVMLAALGVLVGGLAQGQSPLQNAELILVVPKVVANSNGGPYNDGNESGCQGIAKLFKNSDGTWTLTANYVSSGQFFPEGERCSNDVVLNNLVGLINKVHGQQLLPSTTEFVDMLIPSRLRVDPIPGDGIAPQSVLLLTADFRIVEIKGIWGTGGAGVPRPEHIQIHGPLWSSDPVLGGPVLGKATKIMEALRPFDLLGYTYGSHEFDPLIVVGMSSGRIGIAGFDEPALGFENPIISLGDPLFFENPIISLGAGPVKGLALMETQTPGHYTMAALIHGVVSGPQVIGIDLGVGTVIELRKSGQFHAVPPSVVFGGVAEVNGVAMESIASRRIGTDTDIISPPAILFSSALVAVDKSANMQFHTLSGNPTGVVSFDEPALGLVAPNGNPVQLNRISAGSLTAVSTDGQTGLYMPSPELGGVLPPSTGPVAVLGGVHSVDVGPQGFNLGAGGQYFTVRIEAGAQDAASILAASVTLSVEGVAGSLSPSSRFIPQLADKDADGNLELVVKFDRSAVAALLAAVGAGNSASVVLQWDYDDLFTTGSSVHAIKVID